MNWEWWDNDAQRWVAYSNAVNQQIAGAQGSSVRVEMFGNQYEIDTSANTQVNVASQFSRKIRPVTNQTAGAFTIEFWAKPRGPGNFLSKRWRRYSSQEHMLGDLAFLNNAEGIQSQMVRMFPSFHACSPAGIFLAEGGETAYSVSQLIATIPTANNQSGAIIVNFTFEFDRQWPTFHIPLCHSTELTKEVLVIRHVFGDPSLTKKVKNACKKLLPKTRVDSHGVCLEGAQHALWQVSSAHGDVVKLTRRQRACAITPMDIARCVASYVRSLGKQASEVQRAGLLQYCNGAVPTEEHGDIVVRSDKAPAAGVLSAIQVAFSANQQQGREAYVVVLWEDGPRYSISLLANVKTSEVKHLDAVLPKRAADQVRALLFDYVDRAVADFRSVHGAAVMKNKDVAISADDAYPAPTKGVIFQAQKIVGAVLAEQIQLMISRSPNRSEFKFFEFLVVVPNRKSLHQQTADRLNGAELMEEDVTIFKLQKENRDSSRFCELQESINLRKDTAFILLQDEAHWGMTRCGAVGDVYMPTQCLTHMRWL